MYHETVKVELWHAFAEECGGVKMGENGILNEADFLEDIRGEKEQTVFRLAGLLLWSVYLLVLSNVALIEKINEVICVSVLYLVLAICMRILVDYPLFEANVRRYSGIVTDITLTTVLMYLTGVHGTPLFVIYMWVIVGNGFRYGGKHMFFSALLSLLAFLSLSSVHEFWSGSGEFVFTGVMLLVVVPAYLFVLLDRLNTQKDIAKQASEEKSRFIANVSHELRTPLNAIVGFSEMIDKVDSGEQHRMAVLMQEASASLTALIDNVLDFSRIDAGRVDLQDEVVDPRHLLDSIGGMFSLQTREKGVGYRTVVDDNVPDSVAGDAQRIRQVLVNIIGNAIKFTRQGRIDVHLAIRIADDGRQLLHFEIWDTGPGIPAGMRERIFDRFTQVDDSARRKHQGAGLGTAIAKSLVELMGGVIGVESEPGAGSCFWFQLPLRLPSPDQAGHYLDRTTDKVERLHPQENFSVLVAEDCVLNQRVYRKMFDWLGIDVDIAETGEQVFRLLERNCYRLMVVDMQMPGMSGLDIIAQYHAQTESAQRVPVVVITGDATEDLATACRDLGVSAFLAKPVGLPELRALTGRFMRPQIAGWSPQPA